jgi:hypothetical protein
MGKVFRLLAVRNLAPLAQTRKEVVDKKEATGGKMTDISDEVAALERDEFAEARSHEASKISYDFGKAAAQAGLIINGGAATAVIALLAKDKVDPVIFKIVPCCLAIYAIGVTASAIMMYCAMMYADRWNFYWYHLAYTADTPKAEASEGKASYWQNKLRISFAVAMLSFLVASIILAVALALK